MSGSVNTNLTWTDVRDIRQRYKSGQRKYRIAQIYQVSPSTITNITKNQTWKEAI